MTPDTSCASEPRQVCGPELCPIVRGEDVCRDEVREVGAKQRKSYPITVFALTKDKLENLSLLNISNYCRFFSHFETLKQK